MSMMRSGVGYSRTCSVCLEVSTPNFALCFPFPTYLQCLSHLLFSNYLNESKPSKIPTDQKPSRMASSLALRLRSAHLTPVLRPCYVFRSFNTNSARITDEEDRSVGVETGSDRPLSRRRDSSPFSRIFPESIDPIFAPRSLAQMMNLMDQVMDSPFVSSRRGWDVKEDDNTLLLRVDMPGISKEDVKISVQNNTLTIRGEGGRESEEEERGGRKYSSRIDLDPSLYKLDEIKAEMKNGVLKVIVPKINEDDTKNVLEIKVD